MIHYESFIYDFPLSVAPLELGCSSDSECPGSRACENRECVDPCLVRNPCTGIATCRPQNHRAQCFCPEGTTGDGYRSCTPSNLKEKLERKQNMQKRYCLSIAVKRGECRKDADCPTNKACIDHSCVDPCKTNPCAPQAICTAANHIAVCTCPVGWAGNAHEECFQCKSSSLYSFTKLYFYLQEASHSQL